MNALSQLRMTWERNAVAYAFSKISQPERTNFNSFFGDRELLSFLWVPSEATVETKKKTLSMLWNISLPSDGIQGLKNL